MLSQKGADEDSLVEAAVREKVKALVGAVSDLSGRVGPDRREARHALSELRQASIPR